MAFATPSSVDRGVGKFAAALERKAMIENENVAIVKEASAAFSHNDIPRLLNLVVEDVDWLMTGPPAILPYSGARHGRQEVSSFVRALHQAEEIQRFEPKEFIAHKDFVVVLGVYRAIVRANRRTIDLQWVHVYTLRDKKIARFAGFFDTFAATEAYNKPSVVVAPGNIPGSLRRPRLL